jgi:hypothetical protein
MSRASKAASKRGAATSSKPAAMRAVRAAPRSKPIAVAAKSTKRKSATAIKGRVAKAKVATKEVMAARPRPVSSDPELFAPLAAGEIADALRTLSEDRRLSTMYKVGRYRVICTEPLVVKPPHWMASHRLARVVAYDYAADRCVDACVDLDAGVVAHLDINKSQPMLSRDEEAVAMSVASDDARVRERLSFGDEPSAALHYWGRDPGDQAYARRSAAVVFGRPGGHPTLVAVVDLLDNSVTHLVAASQW